MENITIKQTDSAADVAKKLRALDKPQATAETALASVYAAIEKQMGGYVDDGATLSGLAALVNALRRD